MPKGDKYVGLTRYLEGCGIDELTLSFDQIENLIGDTLPQSAYDHRAFWSNTKTHSVAFGWMDAEYKTTNVDFSNKLITFKKK